MKKIFLILIFLILFINIKALENNSNEKEIISVTKYYKTVYYNGKLNEKEMFRNFVNTVEISQEEYDSIQIEIQVQSLVETSYKKLTSSIIKNGNNFRYKAELVWKNMPSTRSYDIIGIGFYSNVKVKNGTLNFLQEYCKNNNDCQNSYSNYSQIFSNGIGTSFKLPEGKLTKLKQVLYFDVVKNTQSVITSQIAASDYSHATSSISLSNSKKYLVNANGIILNDINSYYDNINVSKAIWSGKW